MLLAMDWAPSATAGAVHLLPEEPLGLQGDFLRDKTVVLETPGYWCSDQEVVSNGNVLKELGRISRKREDFPGPHRQRRG